MPCCSTRTISTVTSSIDGLNLSSAFRSVVWRAYLIGMTLLRKGMRRPVRRPSPTVLLWTSTRTSRWAKSLSPRSDSFNSACVARKPRRMAGSAKSNVCRLISRMSERLRMPRVRSTANSYLRSSTSVCMSENIRMKLRRQMKKMTVTSTLLSMYCTMKKSSMFEKMGVLFCTLKSSDTLRRMRFSTFSILSRLYTYFCTRLSRCPITFIANESISPGWITLLPVSKALLTLARCSALSSLFRCRNSTRLASIMVAASLSKYLESVKKAFP
mmetsp:Transcript_5577/g.9579  ORF Transcript_5577/g.9579 Transcript_5577/m.9579 type:complete len:271 (+) Transcript_5577:1772-2584(+)